VTETNPTSNDQHHVCSDEEPEWLRKMHQSMRESDSKGSGRIRPERRDRFVGPIGFNDDGTPVRELSEAERRHNADIRAGRKRPGDPIERNPENQD
jgi:hypothetical protein